MHNIVSHKNKIEKYSVWQKLNESIKKLQSFVNLTISRKIFFFVSQQVFFNTSHGVSEEKENIKLEAFAVSETFHIFESHFVVERNKVVVFENPIVCDKVLQC